MFMGQYQHSLDNKGRLTVPVRYREMLENGAYITQGFDRNLMVWTVSAFEKISLRVAGESITDPTIRLLQRLIFSSGEQVEVDTAGRILIPQFLRQVARLDSTAIVVGVGTYFEIWSPEAWAEQLAMLQDAEANAQRFVAFDISSA
jgi:MraZ protein